MKNVLFLAPGYEYARTVVDNLREYLDTNCVSYTASKVPTNVYVRTDNVDVRFYFDDPVTWTPYILSNVDIVYGHRGTVAYFNNKFPMCRIPTDKRLLSRYVLENSIPCKDDILVDVKTTYIPEIKNVYCNDPVTVVTWEDGTKTIVRCQEGDEYSAEVGLALCIAKKALGNKPNFNNVFRKWIPVDEPAINIGDLFTDMNLDAGTILDKLRDRINNKEDVSNG